MIIENHEYVSWKPRNFSRNIKICSCDCPVVPPKAFYADKIKGDWITVKYEVNPNKNTYPIIPKLRKNQWSTKQHWGTFNRVVELPPIFDKLSPTDFIVRTTYFTRDNLQMPVIYEIEIKDYKKYQLLKMKEDRMKKLKKLSE
jgi:hypothetical protein